MQRLKAFPRPVTHCEGIDAILACISRRAADSDFFGAYPSADIADLHENGFLTAPLPVGLGGQGWVGDPARLDELLAVLAGIGGANLSLGRLYEGHVNAVKLVMSYGTRSQKTAFAADLRAGHMSGVWNADGQNGAAVESAGDDTVILSGGKIWASGAGHVSRAIVTARSENGAVMVLLTSAERARTDASDWHPTGMRATATGSIDLSDLSIHPDRILGQPGDYLRNPLFAGGAWRYLAVQAGAVGALARAAAQDLRNRERAGDTCQQMRFGKVAIAVDATMMWARKAAYAAERERLPEAELKAEIAKARLAIEHHALDVMEAVTRGIGLTGLISPSPIDRMLRDLTTYLRQPGPDQAMLMVGSAFLEDRAVF
jgi:alkylation response protein AidB-like acyl-CoA dehydrogenase